MEMFIKKHVNIYPSFNPLQVGYKPNLKYFFGSHMYSFNPLQVGYKLIVFLMETLLQMCFNPLQVGYKLIAVKRFVRKYHLFQSLIGWLQTEKEGEMKEWIVGSFNPLQVGYKQATGMAEFEVLYPFQSLIGWLQTTLLRLVKYERMAFQSLIGWLQTSFRFSILKPMS